MAWYLALSAVAKNCLLLEMVRAANVSPLGTQLKPGFCRFRLFSCCSPSCLQCIRQSPLQICLTRWYVRTPCHVEEADFIRRLHHSLGYFRDEFVSRRRWLSERSYAGLVASVSFCQGHGHYEALPARVKT